MLHFFIYLGMVYNVELSIQKFSEVHCYSLNGRLRFQKCKKDQKCDNCNTFYSQSLSSLELSIYYIANFFHLNIEDITITDAFQLVLSNKMVH